jgi:hypothetical protein
MASVSLKRWARHASTRGAAVDLGQSALLLIGFVLILLRAATFDPFVDGPWVAFGHNLATTIVLAGVAWGTVRLATHPRSALPYLAALALVVPAEAVHLGRRLHPIATTREYVLRDDFAPSTLSAAPEAAPAPPEPERWLPELLPGASAAVVDGRLRILASPQTIGFVGLRLAHERDPNRNLFWLPRGAFAVPTGEVLRWEAQAERENLLAVVLETRTVRIEATDFGLRVTYLLLDGRLDGADIESPEVARGEAVRYRLERTDDHPLQRLFVGEEEVWARPKPPGAWEFARFGATRTVDVHGGTLTVDDVEYRALFHGGEETVRSACPAGALFC